MIPARTSLRLTVFAACLAALVVASPAAAQIEPCPEPVRLPPRESPPLLRCMQLVAHPVNETVVEGQTYDYYIKAPRTNSETNTWAPYDEDAIRADFWNLWRTGFLDNLWIEVLDEPYANGVMGKHVIFHIEERSRVQAIDYVGADGTRTEVEVAKIEEALRTASIRISLDAFVDEAVIRRVKGLIRDIYAEKGYNDVTIESDLRALPAGPKQVHLTFTIDQGPKYKLREVLFEGNTAFSDGTLRSQMVENKPKAWWSFLTSGGTYIDTKIAEDAEAVNDFYRNKGYVRAIVGQPRVEIIADSPDGRTWWVRLRIPVDEGRRYLIGTLTVECNTALRTEFLRSQFKIDDGDFYNY
jgi:outer membrane protein insertion porin family